MGGDAVSTEFLKAALWRRMKALEDDPSIPLFFGRLDYSADDPAGLGERFYIGRRHVSDEHGDPMVVDWRAGYRARSIVPAARTRRGSSCAGVSGTRTGDDRDEDEHLLAGEERSSSAILESEIERPRVGPMRDIVATIQPEQDEIVRSDLTRPSACRAHPAPARPRSACTGRRTCSTRTATS